MKALTIWQPWASCIIELGKRIENRVWKPPKKLIGNRIAIHAGKTYDVEANEFIKSLGFELPEGRLVHGAIIGVAKVVDCVTESEHPWFCGPYGWVLGDVQPLPTPILCRGSQGLWKVSFEVAKEIYHQMSDKKEDPTRRLKQLKLQINHNGE